MKRQLEKIFDSIGADNLTRTDDLPLTRREETAFRYVERDARLGVKALILQ